ncbi:hypothetical protein ABVT39_015243 [Epinephelus coioides]
MAKSVSCTESAEAPKLAFPNDSSYWHRTGARPKVSTPARTWADVTKRKGKSSRKSIKRAPTLTPPLELSLQNRYDALAPNEMCDNTNYTEPRQANHTCGIKAIQNASNSPKTTARPRARKKYANSTPEKPRARRSIANTTPERPRANRNIPNPTSDQPDTILIGDSITKHGSNNPPPALHHNDQGANVTPAPPAPLQPPGANADPPHHHHNHHGASLNPPPLHHAHQSRS